MKRDLTIPEQWVARLMHRCQVHGSPEEAEVTVRCFAAAFAIRYDAKAFCQQSLDHVGGVVKYFNQATVQEALDDWWRENWRLHVPPRPALAAPESVAASQPFDLQDMRDTIAKLMAMEATPLRQALLRCARAVLITHAPEHVGLIPESVPDESRAYVATVEGLWE
jgi:hypothetical protein